MGISLEQQDGEWYNSLPRRGGVYDLIYTAVSATGTEDRLRAIRALGKSGDPRAVRPLTDHGDTIVCNHGTRYPAERPTGG